MVLGADSAYVIHLDRHKLRKKRMDHLIQKFQLQNINYVKAIDRNDYLDDSFNFSKKHFDTNFWDPNGWCTLGILGCALSHRKAWKQFLDSGDEVGLFLEDDVRNTSTIYNLNFNKIREELDELNSVNYYWGVAILGRYHKEIIHGKQITDNFYRSILHNDQYSGHAYLLNKKSAQWFYENTKKIKYAADIRLEISPFKVVTLKESVFVQRYHDYTKHKDKIINEAKYSWVFEFLHATTIECFEKGTPNSWEENGMLISNYVPVENISYSKKNIKGTTISGYNMVIGDKNNIDNNFNIK